MNIIKKRIFKISRVDNSLGILKKYFNLLDIPIIFSTFKEDLISHPNYPSLQSITEILRIWNIESSVGRIEFSELKKIQFPLLTYLNTKRYIIVLGANNYSLKIYDTETKKIKLSYEEFNKLWTGIVLLPKIVDRTGDPKFFEIKKQNRERKKIFILLIIFSSLFISYPIIDLFIEKEMLGIYFLPIYLSKLIGIMLCLILIKIEFGQGNQLVWKLCNFNKKISCDVVLNSSLSKKLKYISLAEIGGLYFFWGFCILLFSVFSNNYFNHFDFFFILSVITLPFSFYLVLYQIIKLKKVCPFCLMIQIILWLEFGFFYKYSPKDYYHFDFSIIYLDFYAFFFVLIFWILFKQKYFNNNKLKYLNKQVVFFKSNSEVFDVLLSKGEIVPFKEFEYEFILGSKTAPIKILMVTNPNCNGCAKEHKTLLSLLEKYNDRIQFILRFFYKDKNGIDYLVIKSILGNMIFGKEKSAENSLLEWYNLKNKNQNQKWFLHNNKEYPNSEIIVESVAKEHKKWCAENNLHITPTFFLNGKLFPKFYFLGDIKPWIENKLISIEMV